jgi:hypothetical protein
MLVPPSRYFPTGFLTESEYISAFCHACYIIRLPHPSCFYCANNVSEKTIWWETLNDEVHLREDGQALALTQSISFRHVERYMDLRANNCTSYCFQKNTFNFPYFHGN